MLTIVFLAIFIMAAWKLFAFGMRLTWGMVRIACKLLFLLLLISVIAVHQTIRHSGGVSLAKLAEQIVALRGNFTRISTASPRVIVSTYVEEAVYG